MFAPNQAESCPSIASAVAGCEKWKLSARQFMGAPGLQHFPMQLYPASENRACRNLPVRFPNFSHSWLRGGRNYYCDKRHACLGKGRGTMLAVCSCAPRCTMMPQRIQWVLSNRKEFLLPLCSCKLGVGHKSPIDAITHSYVLRLFKKDLKRNPKITSIGSLFCCPRFQSDVQLTFIIVRWVLQLGKHVQYVGT